MRDDSQNQTARPLTDRQQRLLLRAVVGSLVLSAALAAPAAAQTAPPAAPAQQTPRVDPQPFRDLLSRVRRMADDGQLKAGDNFTFTVEAARNPDGTLSDVRFAEQAAANGHWRTVTEEFLRVLSDSRALSYLEDVERVTFVLSLADRFSASLAADAPSEAQAAKLGRQSELMLVLASRSLRGGGGVEVLGNMRASASGKRMLLKLDMSRAEVGNLLSQSLAIP